MVTILCIVDVITRGYYAKNDDFTMMTAMTLEQFIVVLLIGVSCSSLGTLPFPRNGDSKKYL